MTHLQDVLYFILNIKGLIKFLLFTHLISFRLNNLILLEIFIHSQNLSIYQYLLASNTTKTGKYISLTMTKKDGKISCILEPWRVSLLQHFRCQGHRLLSCFYTVYGLRQLLELQPLCPFQLENRKDIRTVDAKHPAYIELARISHMISPCLKGNCGLSLSSVVLIF